METRSEGVETQGPEVSQLVGIKLRPGGRADDYLTQGLSLHVGDLCVVEVPNGHAVGEVRRAARELPESHRGRVHPRVLRRATGEEVAGYRHRRERERAAITTCQLRAKGHGLVMKVVDVEISADGRRVVVLFSAEGRVDFRELVRELAREFRARIEMRQIGARDVTKVQNGIGPCGRQLCCSSYMSRFAPISVRMAKAQEVPLTDSRLLGNCGRLKCCLLYEFSLYEGLRSRLPRVGSACQVECGGGGCMKGRVKAIKTLKESVLVMLADGSEAEVPLSQMTWEGRPGVEPL